MMSNSPIELDPAWYAAIPLRASRRRFTGEHIPTGAWRQLGEFVERFTPFTGTRIVLVETTPSGVFEKVDGYLVEIKGAPSLAIFTSLADRVVEAGYLGEALILEATRLGIGTCWAVGSFHPEHAVKLLSLADGEQIVAVTPLGLTTGRPQPAEAVLRAAIRADRRKLLTETAPGSKDGSWPGWAISAVEAVRLAPSGVNGQPWRFRMDGSALTLSRAEKAHRTWQLDCGIAMLHAELGAQHAGVTGVWERLEEPDVARFVPQNL